MVGIATVQATFVIHLTTPISLSANITDLIVSSNQSVFFMFFTILYGVNILSIACFHTHFHHLYIFHNAGILSRKSFIDLIILVHLFHFNCPLIFSTNTSESFFKLNHILDNIS